MFRLYIPILRSAQLDPDGMSAPESRRGHPAAQIFGIIGMLTRLT
jgi:hypothetical protein